MRHQSFHYDCEAKVTARDRGSVRTHNSLTVLWPTQQCSLNPVAHARAALPLLGLGCSDLKTDRSGIKCHSQRRRVCKQ